MRAFKAQRSSQPCYALFQQGNERILHEFKIIWHIKADNAFGF
jgi:hypothetical protein